MTTIAFDGRTLAADSQQSAGIIDQIAAQKIHRVRDMLIGVAGEMSAALVLLDWIREGEEWEARPVFKDEHARLLIIQGGRAFEMIETCRRIEVGIPAAIGSGAGAALGAMLAGADARAAVKIGIRLDPDSGGRVAAIDLRAREKADERAILPKATRRRRASRR